MATTEKRLYDQIIVLLVEKIRLDSILKNTNATIENRARSAERMVTLVEEISAVSDLAGLERGKLLALTDIRQLSDAATFQASQPSVSMVGNVNQSVIPGLQRRGKALRKSTPADVWKNPTPHTSEQFGEETKFELDQSRLMTDFIYFAKNILTITYRPGLNADKPMGGFGPFILTEMQIKLVAMLIDLLFVKCVPARLVILKARQLGCTTVLLAFWTWLVLTREHFHVMFLIDKDQHGATKREEVVRWMLLASKRHDFFPSIQKRDGKFISLTNGSKFMFESAESPNPGTSEMIHVLHESEKPKWPRGRAQQVEESITPGLPSAPMTVHVDESTAQGMDDFFLKWDRAKRQLGSEGGIKTIPIFFPWHISSECAIRPPGLFRYHDSDPELCDEILSDDGEEIILKESEYAQLYGLTEAQIFWRRTKIKDAFKGNRVSFDQEYPTTDAHAWRSTQQGYFPRKLLEQADRAVKQPLAIGRLVDDGGYLDFNTPVLHTLLNPKWVSNTDGEVKVWSFPIYGSEYFLGVDVAEGKASVGLSGETEQDYSVMSVKDQGGYTVAQFRARVRPEQLWLDLILIAKFYNEAWVNGERNGPGNTLLSYFFRTGYPFMLVNPTPVSRAIIDRTWTTVGPHNRDSILARYRASLVTDPERVVSADLLSELKTFVRRNSGGRVKAEAGAGAHDDIVMAEAHTESARFWRLGFDSKDRAVELPPMPSPVVDETPCYLINTFFLDEDYQ